MPKTLNLAAIDLGASGGRVMLARFTPDQLVLEEVHRFPNIPVRVHRHLYWDVLRLFEEIKTGLCKTGQQASVSSLGLDTWGVDFALLDRDDQLVGNPYHYRDPHTNGMLERAFQEVSREGIFERTGMQFMQINSLFQLLALRTSGALERARTFLMIPDLFNFWLTGRKCNEYTAASTTQFYNHHLGAYDLNLLSRFELPTDLYPEIVPPGTRLGSLAAEVASEIDFPQVEVIAPACHDTGSAVAAAPLDHPRAAYISSGTWSLVGVEVDYPVITPKSLAYNFTNEGGVYGTIRLLKNVAGMWLAQECRRVWVAQGQAYSWDEMTRLAESAPPFGPLVDPDHTDFLSPVDMSAAIRAYWQHTGQPATQTQAGILRCIFESLALKYRWVIESLEEILGYTIKQVHVIGGGSQNGLLCQLTADALQRPVSAGPVEATAIGNALVQAVSLGALNSLAEGRSLVRQSFPFVSYQPRSERGWEAAYERFKALTPG